LIIWSVFGIMNAFAGSVLWLHIIVRSFFGVGEAGNFPASIKTGAEWFPKKERALATSIFNSGTNLGAMIAALFVAWCMDYFGNELGWKMAFIISGAIGFIWLIFWFKFYDSPAKSKYLSKKEYDYIHSDVDEKIVNESTGSGVSFGKLFSFRGRITREAFWGSFLLINIICVFLIEVMNLTLEKGPLGIVPKIYIGCVGIVYVWLLLALQSKRLHDIEKSSNYLFLNLIPGIGTIIVLLIAGLASNISKTNKHGETIPSILAYKQTWAFFVGKLLTDGIWWFYLFWLPDYLMNQFHMTLSQVKWPTFIVFFISIIGSIIGGTMPLYFINRGKKVYNVRMTSMLVFGIFPIIVLTTQYFGDVTHFGKNAMYLVIAVIGIAAAGHQAWSCNLFTTVSDMFPKKAIASVTGIGAMAGGLGGVIMQLLSGSLRDTFSNTPQTAYLILFIICGTSYFIAWAIMKLLVPQHKPITDL